MSDIAKELNVSTVTVSKALGNKEGVSEELRERIIQLAGEMGYAYNTSVKSDNGSAYYNIGILIHEKFMDAAGGNSFYSKIYHSIIRILKTNNCFGILEILDEEHEYEKRKPTIVVENKVDALIILGQVDDLYIDTLYHIGIPTLLLDFYNQNSEYDSIISDSFYGSYMVTNHLIANGHRDIAFVGNIHATSSILDRYLGYCKALIEHHIELGDHSVINDRNKEGKFIEINLPQKMPTAFVCNCDQTAYLLINKLKIQGIKVPDQVSVVGFDNYIISTFMDPPLTTVEVDIEAMAEAAVEAILRKIKDDTSHMGRQIISSNIIYRNSVKHLQNS